MLSLFGGNVENSESRENIHVLVVGDPGLGKSQMLQACERIAVKGTTKRIRILLYNCIEDVWADIDFLVYVAILEVTIIKVEWFYIPMLLIFL